MSMQVCSGAMLLCSFRLAPSSLMVLPVNRTIPANMPAANIMDNKPMINKMAFGACMSLADPTVAAAISAAMGVLTPMPYIPATTAPWTLGAPTVLIANMPALHHTPNLMGNWAGVLTITNPGQMTVMIP